jgi:putative secretion ATPase (PEP-CTERM system associated)
MFEKHYGLTSTPFQLTPDARFFYGSRQHSRALAHLTFGLAQGEGFVVVTGDVGAGKTTLVERVLGQLDRDSYVVARINTTQVSQDDLFRLALAGFGVQTEQAAKSTLLLRFAEALRELRANGRRCLLIVDEVQNLSFPAIEELRMLSNITENGRASLQTILVGQPQFRRILGSPDLDQLRQRVIASYHLGPITEDETRAYIRHRLQTAGWQDRPRWSDAAFTAVFTSTAGVPRRINRLCARVMLYGALEDAGEITPEMVAETAAELDADLEGGAQVPDGPAAPPASLPGGPPELLTRIAALEGQVSRVEHLLKRLFALATGEGAETRK